MKLYDLLIDLVLQLVKWGISLSLACLVVMDWFL